MAEHVVACKRARSEAVTSGDDNDGARPSKKSMLSPRPDVVLSASRGRVIIDCCTRLSTVQHTLSVTKLPALTCRLISLYDDDLCVRPIFCKRPLKETVSPSKETVASSKETGAPSKGTFAPSANPDLTRVGLSGDSVASHILGSQLETSAVALMYDGPVQQSSSLVLHPPIADCCTIDYCLPVLDVLVDDCILPLPIAQLVALYDDYIGFRPLVTSISPPEPEMWPWLAISRRRWLHDPGSRLLSAIPFPPSLRAIRYGGEWFPVSTSDTMRQWMMLYTGVRALVRVSYRLFPDVWRENALQLESVKFGSGGLLESCDESDCDSGTRAEMYDSDAVVNERTCSTGSRVQSSIPTLSDDMAHSTVHASAAPTGQNGVPGCSGRTCTVSSSFIVRTFCEFCLAYEQPWLRVHSVAHSSPPPPRTRPLKNDRVSDTTIAPRVVVDTVEALDDTFLKLTSKVCDIDSRQWTSISRKIRNNPSAEYRQFPDRFYAAVQAVFAKHPEWSIPTFERDVEKVSFAEMVGVVFDLPPHSALMSVVQNCDHLWMPDFPKGQRCSLFQTLGLEGDQRPVLESMLGFLFLGREPIYHEKYEHEESTQKELRVYHQRLTRRYGHVGLFLARLDLFFQS